MSVRGSRLTLALLLGVAVVMVLGTGAALTVGSAQRRLAADPSTRRVVGTTAPPVARLDTTDAVPVAGPSNNLTVQLSPAATAHPRAAQVQQLLQAYFDAINKHDYGAWSAVVTSAQTKNEDAERWMQAYASTVDSSIWVQFLAGSPLRAGLRFTSEQDPDLAPPDLPVDCIDWVLSYQLDEQGGQLVVGSTIPGTVTRARCP